jgi:CheY-like chemotaxis protein
MLRRRSLQRQRQRRRHCSRCSGIAVQPVHTGRFVGVAEIRRHRPWPAICRLLCRTMGGEIGVESEVGHGSKFWFTLQCHVAGAPPKVSSPSLAPAIDPAAAELSILVADDNAIIRKLIFKLVERQRLPARPRLQRHRGRRRGPAEILRFGADGHADARDGRHFSDEGDPRARWARAQRADHRADRQRPAGRAGSCRAAGMDDFLTKPIQPDALYAAIMRWSVA